MEGVLKRAAESKEPNQVIYEAMLSQQIVTVHQMNQTHVMVWCHYRKV